MENSEFITPEFLELADSLELSGEAREKFIERHISGQKAKQKLELINEAMIAVSTHNRAGMDAEKSKDYEAAIREYNLAIQEGMAREHAGYATFAHSINRLAIIYRKQKRYQDEIDILELGMVQCIGTNFERDGVKYSERINKAQQLLDNL